MEMFQGVDGVYLQREEGGDLSSRIHEILGQGNITRQGGTVVLIGEHSETDCPGTTRSENRHWQLSKAQLATLRDYGLKVTFVHPKWAALGRKWINNMWRGGHNTPTHKLAQDWWAGTKIYILQGTFQQRQAIAAMIYTLEVGTHTNPQNITDVTVLQAGLVGQNNCWRLRVLYTKLLGDIPYQKQYPERDRKLKQERKLVASELNKNIKDLLEIQI